MTEQERQIINPSGQSFESQQVKRWRSEFPYHWDADELVARRELLQFAVYTSGALFLGTTVIAVLGLLRRPGIAAVRPITRIGEVPEGEAFYFHYPEPDNPAVLLHLPGGQFVAYSQICTHLACAVYYQPERDRLFCPCHDGIFNPLTGDPVAGPPRRRLPRILLRQEADLLFAVALIP